MNEQERIEKCKEEGVCTNLATEPFYSFKCSECEKMVDDYHVFPYEDVCFGGKFKFCPFCGRKVVNE